MMLSIQTYSLCVSVDYLLSKLESSFFFLMKKKLEDEGEEEERERENKFKYFSFSVTIPAVSTDHHHPSFD